MRVSLRPHWRLLQAVWITDHVEVLQMLPYSQLRWQFGSINKCWFLNRNSAACQRDVRWVLSGGSLQVRTETWIKRCMAWLISLDMDIYTFWFHNQVILKLCHHFFCLVATFEVKPVWNVIWKSRFGSFSELGCRKVYPCCFALWLSPVDSITTVILGAF